MYRKVIFLFNENIFYNSIPMRCMYSWVHSKICVCYGFYIRQMFQRLFKPHAMELYLNNYMYYIVQAYTFSVHHHHHRHVPM